MTFKDFQEIIIARCKASRACRFEFRNLLRSVENDDRVGFVEVLLGNHNWCLGNGICDAELFLQLEDQEVLLEAGLRTQLNSPIEFKVEEIGGKKWKPFNEGANSDNGIGDYFTFDEANDPKIGRLVPSVGDFEALCELPSEWALYQGQFGRLFDGRLFIPAGGFKDSTGTLYGVGGSGYSWSSSVTTGSYAYYLYFGSGGISPNDNYYRAHGLQVRCLQE